MSEATHTTVELVYQTQTDKAYCFKEYEDSSESIWFPKSQVELNTDDPFRGDVVEVTAPDWLLMDKGIL